MALSKPALKARIVAEFQLIATFLGLPVLNQVQLEKFAEALANAIVDEIQANAETVVASGSSAGSWPVT